MNTSDHRSLDELLARYADARLSPSREQLTRLRAALVAAYAGRSERAASRSRQRVPRWRWALVAASALALTLGTSLAAAESGPGQPFYHLRLSLEALSLPPQGAARVEALLARLDARLAEGRQATRRGDHGAAADAVVAYQETLAALSASVDGAGSDQWVLNELARHESVLQELLGGLPAQARPGLQKALEQTQHARDAISHRPATPAHGPPSWAPGASQQTSSP